jgi:hypothetical protein
MEKNCIVIDSLVQVIFGPVRLLVKKLVFQINNLTPRWESDCLIIK